MFTFDSKSCNEDYEGTFFLTSRTSMLILSVDYDSSNDLLSDIEFHFVFKYFIFGVIINYPARINFYTLLGESSFQTRSSFCGH